MMELEKADLIIDICLSFFNDIEIYGKDFEKLQIDRPYVDIIKIGFDTILNGKGADMFETTMESEILWFVKRDDNIDKQMIFELSLFKKFWIISEKEGRKALYEFILSAISPKLYQKHAVLLEFLNNEKDPLENFTSEITVYATYLDKQE